MKSTRKHYFEVVPLTLYFVVFCIQAQIFSFFSRIQVVLHCIICTQSMVIGDYVKVRTNFAANKDVFHFAPHFKRLIVDQQRGLLTSPCLMTNSYHLAYLITTIYSSKLSTCSANSLQLNYLSIVYLSIIQHRFFFPNLFPP